MPESNVLSFVVAEGPRAEQPIARLPGDVTAFVGRTLRGPVDQPVLLDSFADYQQVFGGLWQPSMLSYAVEQFFENGGRRALVVRVVNGGAPTTISLPCGGETLTLVALSPGSREALRASIDYDNIGPAEDKRFNLVLQRVRAPGSEHIEDQEIFRRVSVEPGTARFVATALQESSLARVRGSVPSRRPDRTFRAGARHPIGYIDSNPDGDDGAAITDYDIIGSQQRCTGLFALRGTDFVNFLCIPPPTRERDLGPSALVVAMRLCRELRALLIVDPPSDWNDPAQALRGLREIALANEDALMCFPRIFAYDRLRGRYETFANSGAVAGVLARLEHQRPWWQPGPDEELLLRPGARPVRMLSDVERARLAMHGINPLQSLRAANPRQLPLRTLARGAAGSTESGWLAARRRWLQIMNSLERGTRWVLHDVRDRNSWSRMRGQAETFLKPLADAGLFGEGPPESAFHVICDERLNSEEDRAAGQVHMLVSLRGSRPGEYRSFLITHGMQGSRVRPVRSNVLPAGTRLSIASSADEEAVEVMEHGSKADLEPTQPRAQLAVMTAGPDEPTTPVEVLAPVEAAGSDDATTIVARQPEPPSSEDSTTLVLPLAEGAAPGGLDRDDIARFYRDFGRRGQPL